jgi:hypothetical protein
MMQAVCSSETSATFPQGARTHKQDQQQRIKAFTVSFDIQFWKKVGFKTKLMKVSYLKCFFLL